MTHDMRRLITLCEAIGYHGSSEANPTFTASHTGHNSHTFGGYSSTRHGIFFSNNRKVSALYGQVGRYRLNIRHTLDLHNDKNVLWDFTQSLDPHDPTERPIWLEATATFRDNKYWQLFEDDVGERLVPYLMQRGFDSARFIEYIPDDDDGEVKSRTTVVFDPAKVQRLA
jgi:hypothetical protein